VLLPEFLSELDDPLTQRSPVLFV